MEGQPSTTRAMRWCAWTVVVIAIAFSTFTRVRLAASPLERDEGEYAYAGQLILQGIPPYQMACNMKLPGTYLGYAGLMAIFGEDVVGIHLGMLAVNVASILLLFLFTRELFDPLSAAIAAAVFTVLAGSPSVLGMAGHATHFIVLFALPGVWMLWRAIQRDKIWLLFLAGVFLGLAFLMKQQAMFLVGFGGVMAFLGCERQQRFFSRRNLARCWAYAAGAAIPLLSVGLWLWLAGTFDKFWFWTVQYARAYVSQIPLWQAGYTFWFSVCSVVGPHWILWTLAALGGFRLARVGGVRWRRTFVFGFAACSFLCVCPGFFFRQHYFVVFLPSIAMLAGFASTEWIRMVSRLQLDNLLLGAYAEPNATSPDEPLPKIDALPNPLRPVWAVCQAFLIILLPLAALLFPVFCQSAYYFSWSPKLACSLVYAENPFVESLVIADYIQKHTDPTARIAVLGSEPEIYFYANRKSATGCIYMYPLMENQPFARTMQDEAIAEIEAAKPEYMVLVSAFTSWLGQPTSDKHILQWFDRYAAANYRPVGLIDIISPTKTTYRWDNEMDGAWPASPLHVWVFKRNR